MTVCSDQTRSCDWTHGQLNARQSQVCNVTHSYVRHDQSVHDPWPVHMWDMTHPHVWRDSFIRVAWRIPSWDVMHSHVSHDSFIRATRLIHVYNMADLYLSHDASICETRHIHMCDILMCEVYMWDMTYLCVRHDEFIYEAWRVHVKYDRHDPLPCEKRAI